MGEYGLVAKRDCPKGSCLGYYTGEVVERGTRTNSKYLMEFGGFDIDAEEQGGLFRFVNDPKGTDQRANVRFETRVDQAGCPVVVILAVACIPKGECIWVKYGESYWANESTTG